MTTSFDTLSVGDYVRPVASLHPKTHYAFLLKGARHYFGNELASRVTTKIEKALEDHFNGEDGRAKWGDIGKAQRKEHFTSFRDNNTDTLTAWTKEIFEEFAKKADDGDIGLGSRGASIDPLRRQMEVIARQGVIATLQANKLETPTEWKKRTKGDINDYSVTVGGQVLTMDDMIDRRIANPKFGPAIEKEAKAELDRRAKAAERVRKAAESAKEQGLEAAEDLGL